MFNRTFMEQMFPRLHTILAPTTSIRSPQSPIL
ncbi:hypothetical protein ES332_A09G038500v1 [Gossypium tomentosum]|uniref:Uncharacterized protein n=1 Tax=Gossypium tomentosum TaxID=34277 RepID=A0A5D2NY96_GOSTO|nr:hypothetical protein ES332_A09G038500v1 [Gossypium tomentosum]